MSEGLNQWIGVGNLVETPELRMMSSGSAVLKMRMACGERYKDRDGNWADRTEYVTVVVWGKRAEALSKLLDKGARVTIVGGLRTSSYDDRDGNKRWKTEVNATQVLLGGRGSASSGGRSNGDSERGERQAGARGSQNAGDDDDIPF